MIYVIAERCEKDSDGWMLVSDFAPKAQKIYHIDFSRFGGPNKFLRKYNDVVEVEEQDTPTGGKTSFFRTKVKKAKILRNYKYIILIIIGLVILSLSLLPAVMPDNLFVISIFRVLGTVASLLGILKFFCIDVNRIKAWLIK